MLTSARSTRVSSAKPPVKCTPGICTSAQTFWWPAEQCSQDPQPWQKGATTRSPTRKLRTSAPTSRTTPQYSWPSTAGNSGTIPIHGMPPVQTVWSERQIPQASTSMTASRGPHSGWVQSSWTTRGSPNCSMTAAFLSVS